MPDAEPTSTAPSGGRHPLVQQILDGSAPDAIRLTAARGALPIPMHDLLYLQICLLRDSLPEIAREASDSLEKTPVENLTQILRDSHCDPLVIDHFARTGKLTGPTLEAAIFHPAIPDATLETLAENGSADTLSLILTNETRIIKNPRLVELLRSNTSLRPENRRRLDELERDFVGREALKVREAPTTPQPLAEEQFTADLPEEPVAGEGADAVPELTPEIEAMYEEEVKKTPAFQKVMKMNVAERQQLAMKGSAEERAILIRDTAKLVSLQVLKSPKLGEQEVIVFANMRNVSEEILRVIASRRDWTKTYGTAYALVRNPKTPPGVSLQFLPRLGTRDLKQLTSDKNVPEILRRQARNLFLARTQPPKKLKRKKH